MSIIFKLRQNTYNMRHGQISESQNFRTNYFGLGSYAVIVIHP